LKADPAVRRDFVKEMTRRMGVDSRLLAMEVKALRMAETATFRREWAFWRERCLLRDSLVKGERVDPSLGHAKTAPDCAIVSQQRMGLADVRGNVCGGVGTRSVSKRFVRWGKPSKESNNALMMSALVPDKILDIKAVAVDQLLLDPENPRLESVAKTKDQLDLIKAMWREMAVSEVALSIAANGFFEEEPLFAVPAPKEKGEARYYVVEGNRRLTAVKLLLDEDLRKAIKATDLPLLSAEAKTKLRSLPVSIYNKRQDLWAYFGFRHVNGPKEWDSLSKAAYIAKVLREYGKSLEEITRAIGDQHSTVKRIFRGYVLLEQAEQMTKFKREDRSRNRFFFSHLYTAADYPEVQEFLGIDADRCVVGKKYLPHLEELMVWLFGSKERGLEPLVRTQAPDLSNLRSVIGNKGALAALRSGISLDRAFVISKGDSNRFEEALAQAKDALQEGKGTVTTGYRGNKELLDQMESIQSLAVSLFNEMREIACRKK
jgi:hypothetical protein